MGKNNIAHILIEYRWHLYSTPIEDVFRVLCSWIMNNDIAPDNNNTSRSIVTINLSDIPPRKRNDIVYADIIHCNCKIS